MTGPRRIEIGAEAQGLRLDRFLAEQLQRSRTQIQNDIASRRILLDGEPARPATRLTGGEVVTLSEAPARPAERIEPEHLPLAILFEDADLVVVDKPAGLAVHPGAGRAVGTLCHRLVARYPEIAEVGHPQRPGIVHRLDLGTSGVMAIARNAHAYQALVRAFARRRIAKEYLAIAHGAVEQGLLIDQPIARHPTERKRMTVRAGGRSASTECDRLDLAARDRLSLLRLRLHTGRTHQIRVHLKHAAHPLVGDPVYGEARWKELSGAARAAIREFPRPALHAWRLTLEHPRAGSQRSFTADPPADLGELWRAVGGREIGALLATLEPPTVAAEGAR
ncbi:MAG TPA: RluA family pseudouridine synthase [Thermoanaerobaculia bacterium]|nr:RluA family pseudouridine synthase [Thermoanaerobaculia bacterium]